MTGPDFDKINVVLEQGPLGLVGPLDDMICDEVVSMLIAAECYMTAFGAFVKARDGGDHLAALKAAKSALLEAHRVFSVLDDLFVVIGTGGIKRCR